MKKVLGIFIALALTVAIAVPVVANEGGGTANSTTCVIVSQGGGDPPIIKAKWEQLDPTDCADLEDGDPEHLTPLTQLNPPVAFNASIGPQFWVVATDPNDVSTVAQVWVNVYHPQGPPECGSWKYKLDLVEQELGTEGSGQGIDAFKAACAAGLVTFGTNASGYPYTYEEVLEELREPHAKVYMGVGELSYHQPWGDYEVVANAADINNNYASDWGHDLVNNLTYMPIAGIEVDFTHVNYGEVEICHNAWVPGDKVFGTSSLPTVRNIGNTEVELAIQQDDMGFGYAGTGSNITWNVEFDVRLGATADGCPDILFDPAGVKDDPALPRADAWTTITPTLPLCNTQKINFSIHVKQGASTSYGGNMWIMYQKTDFSGACAA